MRKALLPGFVRGRMLMVLAGLAAVGALNLALRPTALGQTGRTGQETTPPVVLPNQGGGVPTPPGQPEPAIIDVLATGVKGGEQVAYINSELERLWRDNKLQPAERCSDYDFIRRASLDVIGRIPKIPEIEKFMADPPETRRSLLIERLLDSDEFAHNFSTMWTILLMTRSSGKVYREQMYLYLFDEFSKKDMAWDRVVNELLTASGKTNDNGAVNFILAHLGEEFKQKERDPLTGKERDVWKEKGRFEMVPVTSRTTKLFLGIQTQCTQCHDHPFQPDVWNQAHFWGVNAFFRQVDAPLGRPSRMGKNKKDKGMVAGQKELVDNPNFDINGIVPYERRSGTMFYTRSKFLDGTRIPETTKKSRRQELANFITHSPSFSKAFVNRMWSHFFGISFTKDNDADFGEHNPVTHPKLKEGESPDWLLERLAHDWSGKFGHNPRELVRWICNSKAYGLSSVSNKTNGSKDTDRYFSRMLLKAMTPEQLFESLMVATQAKAAEAAADRKKLKEEWLDRLILNFGDDEGNSTSFNGTVVQALLLMNGADINTAIMDEKNGTVAFVIKNKYNDGQAIAHLFMAALNRPPTPEEYKKYLAPTTIVLPRVPAPRNEQERRAFRTGFYQDMFWAILNSGEFYLNH
jgi:hypothetical protein